MSGDRFSKAHIIFETCGTIDAVRARLAQLRLAISSSKLDEANEVAEFLMWLIHTCFLIGSHCNDPQNKHPEYRNREFDKTFLEKLDAFQAELESHVTLPKNFIATASNDLAASTDVLCTEVRRLERRIVALNEHEPAFDPAHILPFVNRLSDTLFMLARSFEDGKHIPVDYGILDS